MSRRHVIAAGAVALACAFVAVGFVGVASYARNYWLYRGFPPPRDPAYVTQPGTQEHIQVPSTAIGGRAQDVYVYPPRDAIRSTRESNATRAGRLSEPLLSRASSSAPFTQSWRAVRCRREPWRRWRR